MRTFHIRESNEIPGIFHLDHVRIFKDGAARAGQAVGEIDFVIERMKDLVSGGDVSDGTR